MNKIYDINKKAVKAKFASLPEDERGYIICMLAGKCGYRFLPASHLFFSDARFHAELNDIIYKLVDGNCRLVFDGEWNPPWDKEWDDAARRDECCRLANIADPSASNSYETWRDWGEAECHDIITEVREAIGV